MKVLILGATGSVGSATLKACLEAGHEVTAFCRTPSKLSLPPGFEADDIKVHIVQGDVTNETDVLAALRAGQDAVVHAAVHGHLFGKDKAAIASSTAAARILLSSVKQVNEAEQRSIRLWIMCGLNALQIPNSKYLLNNLFPLHPEHMENWRMLERDGDGVDWSALCCGGTSQGKPSGPLHISKEVVGLWVPPGIIGKIPWLGPRLNLFYNVGKQKITFESVGTFFAGHLGPGDKDGMTGKRVGILEIASK
ncbi:NAD(P)-binding protein [Atractiella rhizophila]|nr:NAD(P)-binding protein [Atractiella rhizophila]